ncbi:MAG: chromate resistance protein ChrB domain-containing protein [Promethearchaeati archaeon SRVP18_Atabeyarchaeia-1]
MLWVTRKQPHVDRCASAWLIRRWIDKEAEFEFISRDEPIPKGSIAFTLPKAEIKPVEGKTTTFDALAKRYGVQDAVALKVGTFIHDFEVDAEENPSRVRFKETLGLCYVLKGLEKVSRTDHETIEKAMAVVDAFFASLKEALSSESP